MIAKFFTIPFLTFFVIIFPVITPHETGCMGIMVWAPLLFLCLVKARIKFDGYFLCGAFLWLEAFIVTALSYHVIWNNDPYKYLAFVLIFFLLTRYRYSDDQINKLIKYYVPIALVISVLIILSFLGGYTHVDSMFEGSIRYSIGITGWYKNPNYLASFINLALFFFFYILLFRKTKLLTKVLIIGCMATMLVSIVLTGTRAAILTFAGMVVMVVLGYMKRKRKKISSLLPLLILVTFLVVYASYISNFFEIFASSRGGMTDDSRLESWSYAWKRICDSPLFGYGLNSWDTMKHGDHLNGLHNIFLEFLLDQGFIGVLLLCPLMLQGINKIKSIDKTFVYTLMFVTIFPLLFQNGLVDVIFWRVLIMNSIVINFSALSSRGISYVIENSKFKLY